MGEEAERPQEAARGDDDGRSGSPEQLLAPPLESWEAWRRESGAAVPDFARLPSRPFLPSLLEAADGRPVTTPAAWHRHRQHLWEQLCHYFLGRFPAEPPPLTGSEVWHDDVTYSTRTRRVALTFDAAGREIRCVVDVILPADPPAAPLPLFLTQTTHRAWAAVAVSRGYAACIYPAADDDDQSTLFAAAYPDCDWTTIPRRAWLAGRALDYALALPEVDAGRVAVTGHSRNGKQSLVAAALDPRITAVISSSSGSGGSCPFRLMSEAEFAESVEFMTRRFPDWFHPRLRFFTGREDRLPVDIHALVGLIAPRPCLLSTALNDTVETTFAVEQTYLVAREVYALLGTPQALTIRWREGAHGTRAHDIHGYMDWLDGVFGRGPAPLPARPRLHASFDLAAWQDAQPEPVPTPPAPLPWPADREAAAQAVRWSLGPRPPLRREFGSRYGAEKEHVASLMNRRTLPDGVAKYSVQLSDYVPGDLYHPAEPRGLLPVVLWLHPHSYPGGYRGAYMVGPPVYHVLAQAGLAVLTFDLLGYGRRIEEGADFYRRHPRWSRLGRMVRDVQGALDVLEDQGEHAPVTVLDSRRIALPPLDLTRVYALGYGLGAWVGLYAAALEPRLAGLAAFCDLTPFRTAAPGAEHDALQRLGAWHGLVPRLARFQERPREAPYDLEHLLALVAPRPCLLVSPSHDRFADGEAVRAAVDRARDAWAPGERTAPAGTPARTAGRLELATPRDYHRFQPPQHELAVAWLAETAGHG